MSQRIAIVSTKQPGTNPRMRKSANALAAAGFDVHVFYAYTAAWADKTDQEVLKNADWSATRIGGHPLLERGRYMATRIRRKWAKWTGNRDGEFCPSQKEYIKAIQALNPDLVIGHNPGVLPILSAVHKKKHLPVLFDAEDFHRGEFSEGSIESEQVARLEQSHLPHLQKITAASPLIAAAYRLLFPSLEVHTVNNTFERAVQPDFVSLPKGPLRICWFSQIVGLNRGLQEFLNALEFLEGMPMEMTVIGNCTDEIRLALEACLTNREHVIRFEPAIPEPALAQRLASHHLGLAIETEGVHNRMICRTNKLYLYPLCGCFTLLSQTPAQKQFNDEFPRIGETVDLLNPASIRDALQNAASNRDALEANRQNAWNLANRQLNWETESAVLLDCVESLISNS